MKRNLPRNFVIIILLIFFGLITACARAAMPPPAKEYPAEIAVAPAASLPNESISTSGTNEFSIGNTGQKIQERLVIKNATLSIIVDDPAKSLEQISKMADEMGGFVVSANLGYSQLSNGSEVPHGSINIRIPAEKLNEALEKIESESSQSPKNKTIESQDVTSDYTDLQSRLRNLEDAEKQLRTIMDGAFNTDDVLSVYNRLVEVREQIEVIKGQIQYYEQASALSSINVELIANAAVQPLRIGGWQPVGVAKDALQSLISALQFLVNALLWIIIFVLPVLLVVVIIIVLPVRFGWRLWRKRRKSQKVDENESGKSLNNHQ